MKVEDKARNDLLKDHKVRIKTSTNADKVKPQNTREHIFLKIITHSLEKQPTVTSKISCFYQ